MKSKSMPPAAPEERRYRAQDALHTISRAEEHKKDPALMRDVRKLAQDHAKAVLAPKVGYMAPKGGGSKGKC